MTKKKKATKRPVSEQDIATWRKQRRAGETLEAIAASADRNLSVVYRHTKDIEASGGRGRKVVDKEAKVERAKEMRQERYTLVEIADELGISIGTASKWVSDVRKPKSPEQIDAAGMKDAQNKRRQERADRVRNRQDVDDSGEPRFIRVTKMPTNAEDYQPIRDDDRDEYVINPRLLSVAKAIIETKTLDEATGRLTTVSDLEWHKACLILGHATEITRYEDFLVRREQWRAVRELCGKPIEYVATRAGVSPASITRYELNRRSPDSSLWRKLHLVYVTMLDDQLSRHEYTLIVYSYCDAHGTAYDSPVTHTQIMDWYRTTDWEDLTHLAQIRAMAPLPPWRTDDTDLDGYWTPELITT